MAIGYPSAVMLVIGGIVGVGIFVNPAAVARDLQNPSLVLLAWAAGGGIALLGAFVYAELAARMPATGGEYVYLRTTYGPLAGFLFGWTTLLVVHAGGMAAVAIVFADNLNVLFGGTLPVHAVVAAILATLAAINCAGVRFGNLMQAGLGTLKICVIAAIIVTGLAVHPSAAALAALPSAPRADFTHFGAAMIPVMFTYGGWQTANYVAGELKHPARDLARALLTGVIAVIALYLLINLACLRSLGAAALAATATPASDVLRLGMGPLGGKLAAAFIAASAGAFLSQGMLTGPRVFFAMARDGLFFRAIATVSDASHVPVPAILLLAAWTAILALSGTYEQILSYDIATNFLFFGLSASCLFVLRRHERGPAPPAYRAPLHPFSTALFIAACGAIVAFSIWTHPLNSLIGYVIMALGVPPFLFWRRQAQ